MFKNNKKRIFGFVLIFTLLISNISYAKEIIEEEVIKEENKIEVQKTLTLQEAIDFGIENSQELIINDLNIESTKVQGAEARSRERKFNRIPSGFQAEYGSSDRATVFILEDEVASQGAKYDRIEAELKEESIKSSLENNITNAYYSVLLTEDLLANAEETLKNVKQNRDIVAKKLEVGTESRSNLYFEDIALNNALVEVDKAKDSNKKANRGLNMLLDYPLETKLVLTSSYEENENDINLESDLEYAYENRYDFITMSNTLDLVNLNFNAVKRSYTPNTYKYKGAEIDLNKVKVGYNNFKQNIEYDIRSNYDAILSAKKEISLMESNVQKAKEGLRLAKLSYDLETGTSLDVNQATSGLNQAKAGLSNAIANYNTSLLNYKKSVYIGNL